MNSDQTLSDMVVDDGLDPEIPPPSLTPIPVTIEGPISTTTLPTRNIGFGTVTAPTDVPIRVIGSDPHRRNVRLAVSGNACYIAASQGGASASSGCFLATGTVITLTTRDELWALGSGGAAVIGVISEAY